jgi:glycosyltransferase involved in cell wall biosynthesis
MLGCGSLNGILLGPTLRIVQMARLAKRHGIEPILAFEEGADGTWEGMRTRKLTTSTIHEIPPGQAIVATATLHPALFKALIDSDRSFDLDLYGVAALEHIEMVHSDYSDRQIFQSRRRLRRRYRILVEQSCKVYLSNEQQLTFLGGVFFADGDDSSCRLASRLPERTLFLPMGASSHPAQPLANPYPIEYRDRPLFLWGGGIWSWFDTTTLLQAFRILKERNSPAALYFICGSNVSGVRAQDEPVRRTLQVAGELGLLGSNVAFNERGASGHELSAHLQHCAAGIMSNPERLESYASWRTRLLDLLSYAKPVVTSGFDPLSQKLSLASAALLVPSGDPRALADQISRFCEDPHLRQNLSDQVRKISSGFSWEAIFQPWIARISDPDSFRYEARRPRILDLARFVLGI